LSSFIEKSLFFKNFVILSHTKLDVMVIINLTKTEIQKSGKGRYNMAVITLTNENFESEVLKSEKPVLVDFWASWCGPCRMVSPIVDEIGDESDGSYAVGKVNVDEQPEIAARYNIMSIPTLIVFKNGQPAKTSVGVRSKQDILSMLK
jgi:thioredoxin 1